MPCRPLVLVALLGLLPALPVVAVPQAPVPADCALPASPLALADVVRLALCRNPATRAAWLNAEAQAARLDSARAAYRPTLDASVGQTRRFGDGVTPASEDQTSADVALGWLLYDFGARAATRRQAELTLAAVQASRDATFQDVTRLAVDAYYQWFASAAALEASREAETAAAETLRAAGVRQRVGVATREDLLQAQTALSQARLTSLQREGEQQLARGQLAIVLGLPAATALDLAAPDAFPADPVLPALAPFLEEAERRRPDLAAQAQRVAAADASLEQARAADRPDLRLSARQGWSRNDDGSSDSGSVGVSLNIPLYTGGQRAAGIRLAQSQLELARNEAERLRQQVSQEVWEAWQSLRTVTAQLAASDDLAASAEESLRASRARYQAGLGDLINVLNAQSTLASARQQQVKARYDWARARITLARATGTLGAASLSLNDASAESAP